MRALIILNFLLPTSALIFITASAFLQIITSSLVGSQHHGAQQTLTFSPVEIPAGATPPLN